MSAFRCLVCEGESAATVHAACRDYYLGKPFPVDYVRCGACGLLQQYPIPADVGPFYDGYPIHRKKSALHDAMRWLVMGGVYFRAKRLPAGSVVLDYGCGDGSWLESQAGVPVERIGFEMDPAHAARLAARLGIPVYGDPEALERERAGGVDAVTMHFVLEHVTDLHATLARVGRLLKPGGRFYFVVPHASSFEARLFGRKWHNLDPPRHVSFPERDGVDRLAARHGFRVEVDRAAPFPNGFAGSVPVVLSGRFRFPLFLAALPFGFLFSRVFRGGARAYELVRT